MPESSELLHGSRNTLSGTSFEPSEKELKIMGSFPFLCPPPTNSVSAYYLQPSDARAIFLQNDLPCNDKCSALGGA